MIGLNSAGRSCRTGSQALRLAPMFLVGSLEQAALSEVALNVFERLDHLVFFPLQMMRLPDLLA
jgi:hypothetical protein